MSERSTLNFERTEAVARGGMVAAKTRLAAETGAAVLRRGGNAIDAAVTTALTAGVVEPSMSGIGGGGFLVAHFPDRDEAVAVEYPMVSPAAATPGMFPLVGGAKDAELFGWPAVVDSANVVGHRAVAVPGTVAGLSLALERYGTISWAEALEPAIAYAEGGVPVTWLTTLGVARDLANLRRFPATAAIFVRPDGQPPTTLDQTRPEILRQTDLARTLRTLAEQGPRAFYQGEIAHQLATHVREHGGILTPDDLSRYQATIAEPLRVAYHGHDLYTVGKGTGGTTLAQSLALLDGVDVAALGHNTPETLHRIAQAFRVAFADRYAYLADPDQIEVPLAALLSVDYLSERRAAFQANGTRPILAADKGRLDVTHDLAASMPEYTKGGSTTHQSAIDKNGVAVAVTQTLLSVWGSRVVVPGTGVLLNNGMMWFDPEPGRPNSVGGGKRPLSNMSPALLVKDGHAVAAIGASGGRRIQNALAQVAMNLIDHGLTMQPAVSAPRIDASTPNLIVSARLPGGIVQQLTKLGHNTVVLAESQFLGDFASPACVQVADGAFRGGEADGEKELVPGEDDREEYRRDQAGR
ncbi:MAG: gamma-glutamyltransferase, partial [Thermomicrobiales bacterium]